MINAPETSPRVLARWAGFFYLIIIATGLFSELGVRAVVIVSGDAAATSERILANELLYRWGMVSELVTVMSAAIVLTLLYELLKPAGARLARLALIVNVISIAVQLAGMLHHYAPLVYLKADYASVNSAQMQALAYAALRFQSVTYDLSLAFFGLFCATAGVLILKSGYLPRWIGVLMAAAGLCYIANSVIGFVAPPLRAGLLPWILLPCLVGEAALTLWLLIVGVNVEKWRARLAPSAA